MGVCTNYFAIPPQSRLYEQITEDSGFYSLAYALGTDGRLRYQMEHMWMEEERQEIIESLMSQCKSRLGSDPDAKIAQFLSALEQTRLEYPGIDQRVTMIEKCSMEIENQLRWVLQKKQISNLELLDRMMWGTPLPSPRLTEHQTIRQTGDAVINLITSATVREGAEVLSSLTPETLFQNEGNQHAWYRENYARWRRAYLAIAKSKEAIIVCVS